MVNKEELKQEAEELYNDWYAHKLGAISIVDVICKIAEPREKRIAELESTNKKISGECHKLVGSLEKKQNENAELDCQKNRNKFCYSCANATERCFRNEIGCPCEKYKSWKEENAELKADRPQWHILAEEPDVLPEEGQKVKVLTEEGDIENSTYYYDTYYEEFAFSNIGLLKVYAWCELPTFDKE